MKLVVSVVASLAVVSGVAQGQCRVPKESNEAKLLAFFAAPIAFSPAGNLAFMTAGSVRISFDGTYVPNPGADIQRSSLCFMQKNESTRLSPVFPRPRLALGLGAGLFVEASYLPPVTVLDAEPNLGSVALGWVHPIHGNGNVAAGSTTSLALRVHSTFGRVRGPITCNQDRLQQLSADSACYGTQPSKDTYRPNVTSYEGALAWSGGSGSKLAGYVGAAFSTLMPRFQVGFQPTNLGFDATRVEVNLTRVAAFVGGSYRVGARGALTGEVYSVPKDVTTLRIGARWALRGDS